MRPWHLNDDYDDDGDGGDADALDPDPDPGPGPDGRDEGVDAADGGDGDGDATAGRHLIAYRHLLYSFRPPGRHRQGMVNDTQLLVSGCCPLHAIQPALCLGELTLRLMRMRPAVCLGFQNVTVGCRYPLR